jgi:hypothetical protein
MKKSGFLLNLCGAIVALCLIALPAHAQATRTWVSGVGDDANPCSRTAPCKTFAGAISKTAASGEINCLDSGGFGAVTITKSIAIVCEGVIGGVLAALTNGITINTAATDIVYLRGLDIEGATSGLTGVRFIGAGILHVENCLVRGFNGGAATAISFTPTGASELYVWDTTLADSGTGVTGGGIVIKPTGAANVNAVLSNVQVQNNIVGIQADETAGTGTINLSVVDSVSSGNTGPGIVAVTTPAHGSAILMLDRVTVSTNAAGVRADGATSVIRIGNSMIFRNATGVLSVNSGLLQSYQTNQINGNTVDGTPITGIGLN